MSAMKRLLAEYEEKLEEFYEVESASHGTNSRHMRNLLDTMADELRAMEVTLGIPDDSRVFPDYEQEHQGSRKVTLS